MKKCHARALFLSEGVTFQGSGNNFAAALRRAFESRGHHLVPYDFESADIEYAKGRTGLDDVLNRNNYHVVLVDIPAGFKTKHIKEYFEKLSRYPLVAIFHSEATDKILKDKPEHGGFEIKRRPRKKHQMVRIDRDAGAGKICDLAEELLHER